jgi:hypothetical protein
MPMLRMSSGIRACVPTSEQGDSMSEMFSVPLPEKSYKRECQEKHLPFGSVPIFFVSAFSPTV